MKYILTIVMLFFSLGLNIRAEDNKTDICVMKNRTYTISKASGTATINDDPNTNCKQDGFNNQIGINLSSLGFNGLLPDECPPGFTCETDNTTGVTTYTDNETGMKYQADDKAGWVKVWQPSGPGLPTIPPVPTDGVLSPNVMYFPIPGLKDSCDTHGLIATSTISIACAPGGSIGDRIRQGLDAVRAKINSLVKPTPKRPGEIAVHSGSGDDSDNSIEKRCSLLGDPSSMHTSLCMYSAREWLLHDPEKAPRITSLQFASKIAQLKVMPAVVQSLDRIHQKIVEKLTDEMPASVRKTMIERIATPGSGGFLADQLIDASNELACTQLQVQGVNIPRKDSANYIFYSSNVTKKIGPETIDRINTVLKDIGRSDLMLSGGTVVKIGYNLAYKLPNDEFVKNFLLESNPGPYVEALANGNYDMALTTEMGVSATNFGEIGRIVISAIQLAHGNLDVRVRWTSSYF